MDERPSRKGYNYVTVLSNQEEGILLNVEKDRTILATKNLLNNNLSERQNSRVETISLDLWKSYHTAVDEILPKAKKVHDRFHLT